MNEDVPEKPSWRRTWPVVLSGWVLRFATTGREKADRETETQGEQGYEIEDTSATATEVDEATSSGGKAGKAGVGKRRRMKGRR